LGQIPHGLDALGLGRAFQGDHVIGAEILRQLKSEIGTVDRDDRPRAHEPGFEHMQEAERTTIFAPEPNPSPPMV
jgi:hypothetical protein